MQKYLIYIFGYILLGLVTTLGVSLFCVFRYDQAIPRSSWVPSDTQVRWWNKQSIPGVDSELKVVSYASNFGMNIELWTGLRYDTKAHIDWTVTDGRIGGSGGSAPDNSKPFDQLLRVSSGWPALSFRGEMWKTKCPFSTRDDASTVFVPYCIVCGLMTETFNNCSMCQSRYGTNLPPILTTTKHSNVIPLTSSIGTTEKSILIPYWPIWSGLLVNTLFFGFLWFGIFFGFSQTMKSIRRAKGRCPKCAYDLRGSIESGCPECGRDRA